jgi:hypothetical protein
LPWPSIDWTVHVRNETPQMLHGELVAHGAPAFLSVDLAGTAFFGVPPTPSRSFSGRECVVREQDLRARIDSVRVRPTEVIVAVSGEQLSGTTLTLGGLHGQTKQLRRATREVHFPLAGGIPSGSWIALHRGQELLDRRGLDPAWGQADVEIEVDPVTEVEVLINRGSAGAASFTTCDKVSRSVNLLNARVHTGICLFAGISSRNPGGGVSHPSLQRSRRSPCTSYATCV